MNWLTIAWSMCASASIMLGFMHLLLWLNDRRSTVYLLSSLMALSAGRAFPAICRRRYSIRS